MQRIEVQGIEQGTTRVFALSMTGEAARRLSGDAEAQAAALGLGRLNGNGIEVFALSDLGEMGLIGYLREGVDVPEDVLHADRQKLAALDGWVMLVHSSAFAGEDAVLTPWPEITLIGTYSQQKPPREEIALHSEAAQPYSGTGASKRTRRRQERQRLSWIVFLLLVPALFLWWALTGP